MTTLSPCTHGRYKLNLQKEYEEKIQSEKLDNATH